MLSPKAKNHFSCVVCQSHIMQKVNEFDLLPRITSDCRVFPQGGELFVCATCSAVQKRPSEIWLREISQIYAEYASYYQSGGDEQIVFDRVSGRPRRRSDVFLERLASSDSLPATGSVLDVGCGNGVTLSSMSSALPGWTLNGFEMSEATLQRLKAIPRFSKLFSGSLQSINEPFDLVTMIHSLEHFPSPETALVDLSAIVGDGKLFIEVCNVDENPFDILIADHLVHFTPATLSVLLDRCGYSPVVMATDWIPKEISALAQRKRQGDEMHFQDIKANGEKVFRRIEKYVKWLNGMVRSTTEHSQGDRPFGVFGTSIAATWIASQLGRRIAFFVDEDESRVGKQHMGAPILHPRDVQPGSTVYLALAPGVANAIANRLGGSEFTLVLPPAMTAD